MAILQTGHIYMHMRRSFARAGARRTSCDFVFIVSLDLSRQLHKLTRGIFFLLIFQYFLIFLLFRISNCIAIYIYMEKASSIRYEK